MSSTPFPPHPSYFRKNGNVSLPYRSYVARFKSGNFQTRIVESSLAVKTRSPSGVVPIVTDKTGPECPLYV